MKKLSTILLLLPLLWGCNNDERAIRQAAQGYLDAMGNYLIDEAEPYCTPETHDGVLAFARNAMQNLDSTGQAYVASNTPATITVQDVSLENDTLATVSYHKHTPIKEQDGSVDLVKRDGRWLVHIPMSPQAAEPPAVRTDTVLINGKQTILRAPPEHAYARKMPVTQPIGI